MVLKIQKKKLTIAKNESNLGKHPFKILIYHNVTTRLAPLCIDTVPQKVFFKQMLYLKKNYRILPLHELVERSLEGSVPYKSVAITFDDGYQNIYKHAFPILKELNLPATVFLPTSFVGKLDLLWFDRILLFILATLDRKVEFVLDGETVSMPEYDLKEREKKAPWILQKLKYFPPVVREKFEKEIFEEYRVDPLEDENRILLNWDQVNEMGEHCITFGAHTANHSILTTLSLEKAKQEIAESVSSLKSNAARTIPIFAYPNGTYRDFNLSIVEMLKSSHQIAALTTVPGINTGQIDPFALRRSRPWENSTHLFSLGLFAERILGQNGTHCRN